MRAALARVALALLAAAPAAARDIRVERVRFAPGATEARVEGRVTGYDGVDYRVGVEAGRTLSVTMETDHPAAYFNLTAPGARDVAYFNGSIEGNAFQGVVEQSGFHTIRVYLMRSAARRSETADYALEVAIGGAVDLDAPVQGDFADGLAGGPDFWEVATARDPLNVRAAPSLAARVTARAARGATLRNGGCRIAEGRRWCRVSDPQGAFAGWAAGEFLREGAAPAGLAARAPAPKPAGGGGEAASEPTAREGASAASTDAAGADAWSGEALAPGADFHAVGEIDCSADGGPPGAACPFGVRRTGPGAATLAVASPDGETRLIRFEDGAVAGVSGAASFSATRGGDATILRIGLERYDIPDAAVFGG